MKDISRSLRLAGVFLSLCSCTQPPGKSQSQSAAALIEDAAHGGRVPGFFFLPPLVKSTTSGTCQQGLAPIVRIEELAPGTRGTIATFTRDSGTFGATVKDDGADHYQVNWDTKPYDLDAALTYRIHVRLENVELGFADVDVVESGSALKNVETAEYVPLLDGRTLPIKFRIQPEALLCVGVSCTQQDRCHDVGVCEPRTGVCSNPPKTDGTSCDGPSVTMGGLFKEDATTPQNTCADGAANPATLSSGYVRWSSSDPQGSGTTFSCELSGPISLDAAACSALIGNGPSASEYQFHFTDADGGARLPDGVYTLTVFGTDRWGARTPAAGAGIKTWHVDGTSPTVTYVDPWPAGSPPYPGWPTVAIRAPGSTLDEALHGGNGSFNSPDDANGVIPGPAYVCTTGQGNNPFAIDPVSQACTPAGGYSIAAATEGLHSAQITATDCVGNQTMAAAVPYSVDLEAPITTLSVQNSGVGLTTIVVSAADAITNVEDVFCTFDDEDTDPMVRCPGLLRPPDLPTAPGFNTFLTLAIWPPAGLPLAPGSHFVRYRATDIWGHVSPTGRLDFQINASAVVPPTFTGSLTVTPNVFVAGTSPTLSIGIPVVNGFQAGTVTLQSCFQGICSGWGTPSATLEGAQGGSVNVFAPNKPSTSFGTMTLRLSAENAGGIPASVTAPVYVYPAPQGFHAPRIDATATQLDAVGGHAPKVLIAGGSDPLRGCTGDQSRSAELYDPETGVSTVLGNMSLKRCRHTALKVGIKVYLLGGTPDPAYIDGDPASIDVFDETTGTFQTSNLPTMAVPRAQHASVVASGKIYSVGGAGIPFWGGSPGRTVEVFDPASGTSTLYSALAQTNLLSSVRIDPTATVMRNSIVVIGGNNSDDSVDSLDLTAPVLRITNGSQVSHFSLANPSLIRSAHSAVALDASTLTVAGGYGSDGSTALSTVRRYSFTFNGSNVVTGVSVAGGGGAGGAPVDMQEAHVRAPIVLLGTGPSTGNVLLFGGTSSVPDPIAQIDPLQATGAQSRHGSLPVPRLGAAGFALSISRSPPLNRQLILIAGGNSQGTADLIVGP